ncbi:MAG: HAD family phosphatase [Deltaproteobacteria bacterium]|nr:HAD family phosphatase [Deltaproteobacteria bacterium]
MASSPHSTVSAVIFDVDGTMIDNHRFHFDAWVILGKGLGIEITPELYATTMNSRTNADILRDLLGSQTPLEQINELELKKEALYRDLYAPHLALREGLLELLDQFAAAGIPLAAASNAPRENVDFAFEKLGIQDRFLATVTYKDVLKGKPDPEMFLLAAKKLERRAEECLIFEDSPSGIRAARSSGAAFIIIDNPALKDLPDVHAGALAIVDGYRDAKLFTALRHIGF